MEKPVRTSPAVNWEHIEVYNRVQEALYAVPAHFSSATNIEGIRATDIHTLNTVLGATIEDQFVASLNRMRPLWDPDEKYQAYSFHRQAQKFPDVLLKKAVNGTDILLGIELKGWYLFAKEKEPNFRFVVTPAACAEADLLVVVPWALSNVLSGRPIVFKPYMESAQFAAVCRNYHWQEERKAKSDPKIVSPKNIGPYPLKSDRISDEPASDSGGNFGRFARSGLMDEYVAATLASPMCGIPFSEWVDFFKRFQQ